MARDRLPNRRGAPLESSQSYIDRRTGLAEPPEERRRRRSLEREAQIVTTPFPDTGGGSAHDPVTVSDTASINMSLSGQIVSADAIFGTSAGTIAQGNHTHTSAGITDFTEAAQDVIGALLVDTATLDFSYNDVGNAESVEVIADTTVQKTDVRKNSAGTVFSRRRLNLIEGTNVTLTVADDGTDNEVDVTIAAALAGGGGGLTLIDEDVFSGVASDSFDNVFSATYENYRLIVKIDAMSASAANLLFRWRVSGADDAGAASQVYAGWTVATGGGSGAGASASATSMVCYFSAANATVDMGGEYTIYDPFSASSRSRWSGTAIGLRTAVDNSTQLLGGQYVTDRQHTGITILPSSGTITGSWRVYGIQNTP